MDTHTTPRGLILPGGSLHWKFSRSSGPGGQHVNTSSTRASLTLDLQQIPGAEGERLREKHGDALTVHASSERSQHQNRLEALQRLSAILDRSLHVERARKRTRMSRAVKARNAERKVRKSALKAGRRQSW